MKHIMMKSIWCYFYKTVKSVPKGNPAFFIKINGQRFTFGKIRTNISYIHYSAKSDKIRVLIKETEKNFNIVWM